MKLTSITDSCKTAVLEKNMKVLCCLMEGIQLFFFRFWPQLMVQDYSWTIWSRTIPGPYGPGPFPGPYGPGPLGPYGPGLLIILKNILS